MPPPLLKTQDLRVEYTSTGRKPIHALNGVSLEIKQGEVLGVLGESGCGKSTLAKSLIRLLPRNARITAGTIEFGHRDLLRLAERDMERMRGDGIGMIPQEPGLALNPVMKVGDQIAEVIRAHRNCSWKNCVEKATELLERVNLLSAERRMYDAYPHQLSGGQQQRVVVAQAVACQPSLVIADEPTSSLDPQTEAEILELLRTLKANESMSLLLITHDPRILDGLADRVAVMYAGRVVEEGSLEQVLHEPQHPYTKALLGCVPPPFGERKVQIGGRLPTIEGNAPDPESSSVGCTFAPRCINRVEICESQSPVAIETEDSRHVECFLYGS
jgi:oligopeptide/dipeptide ABC transporter ATP-binding protein